MLRGTQPLVLLLGNQMPESVKEHPCFTSEKISSVGAGFRHEVEARSPDHLFQKGYKPLRTHVSVHMKLFNQDGLKLEVKPEATNDFGQMIEGTYSISYASESCVLLKTSSGSPFCTVWILASTIDHQHTDCKKQFKEQCVKPGEENSGH
ncbi:uncharacterized protein LOC142559661 [Dermacentor variabilis]|uniref:uncharacterized protein LOC142559661 n=1 Tax=Dermacentor variabilis TaxID=34621 RepID=UPI003F5C5377